MKQIDQPRLFRNANPRAKRSPYARCGHAGCGKLAVVNRGFCPMHLNNIINVTVDDTVNRYEVAAR